jgi:hypothetical protein
VSWHFAWVPAAGGDASDSLNRFCASHTVVSVTGEFVASGECSGWAFCVGYVTRPPSPAFSKALAKGATSEIDYRDSLKVPREPKRQPRLPALPSAVSAPSGRGSSGALAITDPTRVAIARRHRPPGGVRASPACREDPDLGPRRVKSGHRPDERSPWAFG